MWTKYIFSVGVALGTIGASRALASDETTYQGWFDFDSELQMFFVTTPTEVVYIPYFHSSLTPQKRQRMVNGAKENDNTNSVTLSADGDVIHVNI